MIPYQTYQDFSPNTATERHFLLKNSFNLPYAKDCRLDYALSSSADLFEAIDMTEGDIITIRIYKTSKYGTLYTYLVCYYSDGHKINCGYETSVSLDFLLINDMLFEEVTQAVSRDQRIDRILGYYRDSMEDFLAFMEENKAVKIQSGL